MLPDLMPIGAAILWSPFFLLAHAVSTVLDEFGASVPLNGFGILYEGTVGLGNVIYGIVGLWLIWRIAGRRVDRISALVATLGIWLLTNVPYYMVVEPSMNHTVSLFAAALFLFYWDRTGHDRSTIHRAALGAMADVIALVRVQDVLFSLIILPEIIASRRDWRKALANTIAFSAVLVVVFAPQMFVWKSIFGAWLTIPQGEGFLKWTSPQVGDVLFSTYHGLFLWHPFYLLGFIGLLTGLLRSEQGRPDATALLLAFLSQVYVNSIVGDWYTGDSFRLRRFISSAPVLVIGAVELAAMLAIKARSRWPGVIAIAILIAWNAMFMVQYRFGFIPMSSPLTFEQIVLDKFRLPFMLLRRLRSQ